MPDNKTRAPMDYYSAKYAAANPEELSARSGIVYFDGYFHVTMLGYKLRAAWPEFSLVPENSACPAAICGDLAGLLVIRFLLEGVSAPSSGRYLSYREFPWGEVYSKAFEGRCVRRLAYSFGSRICDFIRASEKLGAVTQRDGFFASKETKEPVPLTSFTVGLPFFEDIHVRLTVHSGDEEFPPSAQFLFSDNAAFAFSAEDLAVAGDIIISALKIVSS